MNVRIYQYDGHVSRSMLHASCVVELQMTDQEFEREFEQNRDALLQEYNGDFFTFNEPPTETTNV